MSKQGKTGEFLYFALVPLFQAHAKGVNTTTSGLIFSFYAFVMFVSSPIFGKIVS
jgi:predicted MFS family arabinose efflux permease